MQSTSAGIVSGDEVPAGVPPRFHLIGEAMNTLMSYSEEKSMFGEAKYKELFDELVSNEKEWLEVSLFYFCFIDIWDKPTNPLPNQFFDHPMNVECTGQTSLVLQELLAIYSGRKSWEEFGAVLDVSIKVMHILKQLVEAPGVDKGHKRACDNTEYRMHNFQMEMKTEMGIVDIESVQLLKKLVNFEVKYKLGTGIDQSNIDQIFINTWVMHSVAMKNRGYKNLSININEVADEDLLEHLTFTKRLVDQNPQNQVSKEEAASFYGNLDLAKEEKIQKNLQLLFCASCNKQESTCGSHKECPCGLVVYCNRSCQRAHLKKHKKSCTKAKK